MLIFFDKIQRHGTSYRAILIALSLFNVCYGLISQQRQDMSESSRGRIEELKERYARDQESEGRGVDGRVSVGKKERKEASREGRERRPTADRTIQSSQEATKGQQRADQIIQFIWIGERAGE